MAPKPKKSMKSKPIQALARVGDPLVSTLGEIVEPEKTAPDKKKKKEVSPSNIDPAGFRPMRKRNLKELPAERNVITGVGAVFMYTLCGVGDREIAEALGTTVEEIVRLREHSAYAECFHIVHSEFINSNSDLLSARIAAASQGALDNVIDLANNAKKEEVQFGASKDILDRAGVRPKDQETKSQTMKQGLRIIIVDGEKSTDVRVDLENIGAE